MAVGSAMKEQTGAWWVSGILEGAGLQSACQGARGSIVLWVCVNPFRLWEGAGSPSELGGSSCRE
jgi:hypothetical protein